MEPRSRYDLVQCHFIEETDRERLEKALGKEFKRAGIDLEGGKPVLKPRVYGGAPVAGSGWISTHPEIPGTRHIIMGDVCKLSGAQLLSIIGLEVGELDFMHGSPPCQGFSTANDRRHSGDTRNQLLFEYARLICEVQPKSLTMENVPGIVNMKTPEGIPVVDKFIKILEDGGFHGIEAFEQALKGRTGSLLSRKRSTSAKCQTKE